MLKEIKIDGKTYVDKEQLYALIREHKEKSLAGTEPGFIEKSEKKRLVAYIALNHLQACLVNDEERERMYENVKKNREKARAIVAITKNADGKYEMQYFAAWVKLKNDLPEKVKMQMREIGLKEEESAPLFAVDWEDAMVFEDAYFAEFNRDRVKAFFNEDDVVRAVAYRLTQTERGRNLLMAILANDTEDEEEEEK